MLAGTQRRTSGIVSTTGITATTVATGRTGTTRLSGTRHGPGRLRTAWHGRTGGTQRSTRAGAHGRLLLTSLRLRDPLSELWIWRHDGPAGLRLRRTEALATALQGRAALLRRPRHRRRTRSNPCAIARQRLIRLGPGHRHTWGTACGCRGRSRRTRRGSGALRRNDLTRSRCKRNPLRWAWSLWRGRRSA